MATVGQLSEHNVGFCFICFLFVFFYYFIIGEGKHMSLLDEMDSLLCMFACVFDFWNH